MKHKIGDVVLVPMRIGELWPHGTLSRRYVSVPGNALSAGTLVLTDDFLDTCAAAPRVPKVGDRVQIRGEENGVARIFVVDIDGQDAIIKYRSVIDGEELLACVVALADLIVVEGSDT